MKLIIDTDPGVDDAMAFYYAHASAAFDLVALTTIFGNVTIENATRNACWLVETAHSAARVYQGERAPLIIAPNPPSAEVHGPRGFGAVPITEPARQAETEGAADALVRMARAKPGELTVCAVGPLTNIARAIEIDRDFVSNLHQLVIMGGALDAPGNVSAVAEANFWNDPHAAHRVITAPGAGRIVIVGLDVTQQIKLSRVDMDVLATASPKTGGFLRDIAAFYIDFYERRSGLPACSLHDPSAVIACHLPDLFTLEETPLAVVTDGEEIGNLVRAETGRVCHVCVDVDAAKVLDTFKTIISQNP